MTARPPYQSGAGFTLVETILVVALFAVMMGALAALYLSFGTSTLVQKAMADISFRANRALETLHADVGQAQGVLASHAFDSGTTYFSGVSALVLALPSIDASGTVIAESFDYVAYYLDGASLYRRLDADAASARQPGVVLLANAIETFTFGYDTADFTQVTRVDTVIVSTKVTPRGSARGELHGRSYLRNAI